jgi:hypothetical protein
MADISNAEVIVAAAVGTWTAADAVLKFTVAINERRDSILTGHIKEQALTHDHRELILYNDWLPMAVGLAMLCLLACSAVIAGPWLLIPESRYALAISLIGCLMFLLVATSYVIGNIKEFLFMRKVLNVATGIKQRSGMPE